MSRRHRRVERLEDQLGLAEPGDRPVAILALGDAATRERVNGVELKPRPVPQRRGAAQVHVVAESGACQFVDGDGNPCRETHFIDDTTQEGPP